MKPRNNGSRRSQKLISAHAEVHGDCGGKDRSKWNQSIKEANKAMVKQGRQHDRDLINESRNLIPLTIDDAENNVIPMTIDDSFIRKSEETKENPFAHLVMLGNGKHDIEDYNQGISLGEYFGKKI